MKNKEIRKSDWLLILLPIFLITLGQILGKMGSQFVSILDLIFNTGKKAPFHIWGYRERNGL